jgi:hypothetical protein
MGDCSQTSICFTQVLLPALSYVLALVVLAVINKREFARCPERGERYEALPLLYKFTCWFAITPLFIASVFVSGAFFFIAIAIYIGLEIACVRWYRRNGFWD